MARWSLRLGILEAGFVGTIATPRSLLFPQWGLWSLIEALETIWSPAFLYKSEETFTRPRWLSLLRNLCLSMNLHHWYLHLTLFLNRWNKENEEMEGEKKKKIRKEMR